LTYQSLASCAECGSHYELAPAHECAREQQVCEVCARDEQHAHRCAAESEKEHAGLARELVAQPVNRECHVIKAGIGRAESIPNGFHFRGRLCACNSGLELRQDVPVCVSDVVVFHLVERHRSPQAGESTRIVEVRRHDADHNARRSVDQ
jgi:hypothetical protein